jgi:hypothetical protein
MKKKIKVQFDTKIIEAIYPGAKALDYLPRKKKKALKKKVAQTIIDIAGDEVLRLKLIDRLSNDSI